MKIAAYGAGRDFENFLLLLRSNDKVYNDEIVLLVDSDQEKWGKHLGKYLVEPPAMLENQEFDILVITSLRYIYEIGDFINKEYPGLGFYSIQSYRDKKTIDYHIRINNERNRQNNNYFFKRFDDGRMVIYTAIFGDYDELHEPLVVDSGIDYICFTDQKTISSDIWKIKYVENENQIDNRLLTRRYKLMPHRYLSEYDTSIWMDASMQITESILDLIKNNQNCANMLFFPHEGTCIYDVALSLQMREKKECLLKQIFTYYQDGYPMDNGLIFGGFLVRNHNQRDVVDAMESWYAQVELFSKRDQISLPYVLWKNHIPYDLICAYRCSNKYFKIYEHKLLSYAKQVF